MEIFLIVLSRVIAVEGFISRCKKVIQVQKCHKVQALIFQSFREIDFHEKKKKKILREILSSYIIYFSWDYYFSLVVSRITSFFST